jgi:hypothetical protein
MKFLVFIWLEKLACQVLSDEPIDIQNFWACLEFGWPKIATQPIRQGMGAGRAQSMGAQAQLLSALWEY